MELPQQIIQAYGPLQIDGFFLGGSHAKGFSDPYSDKDFCVVASSLEILPQLKAKLEEAFGNCADSIERSMSTALHFKSGTSRFEIRFVVSSDIYSAVQRLKDGLLLDGPTQDLLFNIKNGLYFHSNHMLEDLKNQIVYSDELKRKTIQTYLPLLSAEGLEVPTKRGDQYQLMAELINLKEAVYVLGHAYSRRFLTNFKHERQVLHNLPTEVGAIYESARNLIANQDSDALKNIQITVNLFRGKLAQEVYGTIKNA